jgi:hypothetical protein
VSSRPVRLGAAAALVLSLAGCALPQEAERFIVRRGEVDAVIAARYAGRETNPIDTIRIELAQAPAFELLMPDGTWLESAQITHRGMLEHGARADGETRALFNAPGPDSSLDWWGGRHAVVMLFTLPSGAPGFLDLSACGKSFPQLLRSKDGAVFGFPLAVEEFARLFGPVTRRDRFGVITGISCL